MKPPDGLLATGDVVQCLSDAHAEAFLADLRDAGYAEGTLQRRRSIAVSFVRWSRRRRLAVKEIDESCVAAFIGRVPRRSRTRDQVALERATLRRFLRHLRGESGSEAARPWMRIPYVFELERRYVDYLRSERGLTERSICVYAPFVRALLTWREGRSGSPGSGALDAPTVRDFLVERVRNRSRSYTRLLAAAIRSFLRFLHLRGETAVDLSPSVPAVRTWSQAVVHPFLSPDDVDRVVSATDRSTPRGRRDHAILLLLIRLGLRAGEVVTLDLGDIRWRTGEIIVRGKGRVVDRLPLLSDVGAALALYLRSDRGPSSARRVFLRTWAPRVGFVGPAAIDHIVRKALARAGVRRTGRGAAHLFRHSLATRMIRHGASISEIAQVLRHRSQGTTEVYAKVAFEALRGVARCWPGTGGAR